MTEFLNFLSDTFGLNFQNIMANMSLDLALKWVILYVLVVWIAFVVWVVRDISNRSESIIIQTFSILVVLILTPIFGLPVYLLIRPRNTLFERYYEEIELSEAEAMDMNRCGKCGEMVDKEFRYCPHCREELLFPCTECEKLVNETWEACPYCGTDVVRAAKEIAKPKKKSVRAWEEKPLSPAADTETPSSEGTTQIPIEVIQKAE